MTSPDVLRLRAARPEDAPRVARLHADSWRRHYRGAYSDAFLDGDVQSDRLVVWSDRLAHADGSAATILAENGEELVGFIHVVFDADHRWGSLIDNIHVAAAGQRDGVGTRLIGRAAAAAGARAAARGLYLWVLEQNTRAQAFYDALGGRALDREPVTAPGGVHGRLNGAPMKLRYAWPDAAVLVN